VAGAGDQQSVTTAAVPPGAGAREKPGCSVAASFV
jgi:hypothetical protein